MVSALHRIHPVVRPDLLTQRVKSWFPKSPGQAPRRFTRAGLVPRAAAAAHLPDPACLGRALLFHGFRVAVNVNSALEWKAGWGSATPKIWAARCSSSVLLAQGSANSIDLLCAFGPSPNAYWIASLSIVPNLGLVEYKVFYLFMYSNF